MKRWIELTVSSIFSREMLDCRHCADFLFNPKLASNSIDKEKGSFSFCRTTMRSFDLIGLVSKIDKKDMKRFFQCNRDSYPHMNIWLVFIFITSFLFSTTWVKVILNDEVKASTVYIKLQFLVRFTCLWLSAEKHYQDMEQFSSVFSSDDIQQLPCKRNRDKSKVWKRKRSSNWCFWLSSFCVLYTI